LPIDRRPTPARRRTAGRRPTPPGRRFARWALAAALLRAATPGAAAALQDPADPVHASRLFRFHSDFWLNLHHTLHAQARARLGAPDTRRAAIAAAAADTAALATLPRDERRGWDQALAAYGRGVASRDLLFNRGLEAVKNRLSLLGAAEPGSDPALPPTVAAALEAAAPAYRRGWWPAHDAANRRWVAALEPLLRGHEDALAPRLAAALGASWPADPIRVDVSAYANWAGAYTTLEPTHVVISSTAPGNAGPLALETVFHEAGHALVHDLRDAIAAEARAAGAEPPERLWHSVLFYTAGELVRGRLPDLVPYAEAFGLWERGDGPRELEALREEWQPWLDGNGSFRGAVRRVVRELAG
jgi:hypothetical protein